MKQPYSRHGDCLTTDIIFNRQNQHSNRQMNPQNKESTTGANLQPADLQMKVTTDYNVWKLFFQGQEYQKEHRYSKAGAYFDLVNRQRLARLTEDDSYVNGGILALAHAWSWDRTTLKKNHRLLMCQRSRDGNARRQQVDHPADERLFSLPSRWSRQVAYHLGKSASERHNLPRSYQTRQSRSDTAQAVP